MIHSVKMMSVDLFQSGGEQGMIGSSLEVESNREMEIEMRDKVTIAEPGVEFEFRKNKAGVERELLEAFCRSTTTREIRT